jgi:hypothetical protein
MEKQLYATLLHLSIAQRFPTSCLMMLDASVRKKTLLLFLFEIHDSNAPKKLSFRTLHIYFLWSPRKWQKSENYFDTKNVIFLIV